MFNYKWCMTEGIIISLAKVSFFFVIIIIIIIMFVKG